MTPYYEQSGITIYHGDCRDLLSQVVDANLLVTDPPYRSLDIDVIRGTTTRLVSGTNRRGGDRIGTDWFVTLRDDELAEVMRTAVTALPADGAAYVFGDVKTGLLLFPWLQPANVLVWDKGRIGMGYSWRRSHEWIAYCPRSKHQLRRADRGDMLLYAPVQQKLHPTEKPTALIGALIENSSDAGAVVLDPFCGVGSTLVAAKDLSRRAIGIELDERYCEIAAKRLSQEVLPLGGAA
jgi:DNA modification methylase